MITAMKARYNSTEGQFDKILEMYKNKTEDEIIQAIEKHSNEGKRKLKIVAFLYCLRTAFCNKLKQLGYNTSLESVQNSPLCILNISWDDCGEEL